MTTTVKVIMTCGGCGQKNRVLVGSVAKCGRCGHQLSGFSFPQDYQVCGGCGVTFHVRDGAKHDACNPKGAK